MPRRMVSFTGGRGKNRWALALGCLALSCSSAVDRGFPSPPQRSVHAQPEALTRAIADWHEDENIEPLAEYVAAHPDAELGVWREVVALQRYDACGASRTDVHGLRTVLHEFPDTIAGRIAGATLMGDGLSRLRAEIPGPLLVDFLAGGDAWTRDLEGRPQIATADAERVRSEEESDLRSQLAAALLRDGCEATMGYCAWWLSRYPGDADTAGIAAAATKTWYRRGHPSWRGNEHARCALRCAKNCKANAKPLDDSCYQPCYARC